MGLVQNILECKSQNGSIKAHAFAVLRDGTRQSRNVDKLNEPLDTHPRNKIPRQSIHSNQTRNWKHGSLLQLPYIFLLILFNILRVKIKL